MALVCPIGFAHHLASASSQWPVFKHVLPEIAFAGHSNSGKSENKYAQSNYDSPNENSSQLN